MMAPVPQPTDRLIVGPARSEDMEEIARLLAARPKGGQVEFWRGILATHDSLDMYGRRLVLYITCRDCIVGATIMRIIDWSNADESMIRYEQVDRPGELESGHVVLEERKADIRSIYYRLNLGQDYIYVEDCVVHPTMAVGEAISKLAEMTVNTIVNSRHAGLLIIPRTNPIVQAIRHTRHGDHFVSPIGMLDLPLASDNRARLEPFQTLWWPRLHNSSPKPPLIRMAASDYSAQPQAGDPGYGGVFSKFFAEGCDPWTGRLSLE